MITWRIAPAPIPKQSAIQYGLTACVPMHDAGDRRQAGERGEAGEGGERRPFAGDERRGDADALGDVVDDEADDEEGGERRRAGGERRADRRGPRRDCGGRCRAR